MAISPSVSVGSGRDLPLRGSAELYARLVSEREQNWYSIGEVGWFTGHVREGVEVTTGQLDLLRRALAEPYRLDDATVSRIIRVHEDQAADVALFRNQADRWNAMPGLDAAQRAAVAEYEAAIGELRRANPRCSPPPPGSSRSPSRRCWPNPTCRSASKPCWATGRCPTPGSERRRTRPVPVPSALSTGGVSGVNEQWNGVLKGSPQQLG